MKKKCFCRSTDRPPSTSTLRCRRSSRCAANYRSIRMPASIAWWSAISTTRRCPPLRASPRRGAKDGVTCTLRLAVADIRRLGEAAPFAWSAYRYVEGDDRFEFGQEMKAAAGLDAGNVGWDGDELIAVRLHLPSRVDDNNSPSPSGGATSSCGNNRSPIGSRECRSRLRRGWRGVDPVSYLALFGGMAVLVAVTFAGFIWFVKTRKP